MRGSPASGAVGVDAGSRSTAPIAPSTPAAFPCVSLTSPSGEDTVLAWLYVMDAFEGGLPSARYLGLLADAAECAGAPERYVRELRTRESRNVGPGA